MSRRKGIFARLRRSLRWVLRQLDTSAGTADNTALGDETGYRVALGQVNSDGIGTRLTYFEFDNAGEDSVVGDIAFETYNIDLEVFKQLDLSDRSVLEFGGGLRYNSTRHFYDGDQNHFDGIGAFVSSQAGFNTTENGLLFVRAKWAILSGTGNHDGDDADLNPANDVIRTQTEIAIGYEHSLKFGNFQVTPRVGYELQDWSNFGIDPVDEHPDNSLGLSGFVFGLGIAY